MSALPPEIERLFDEQYARLDQLVASIGITVTTVEELAASMWSTPWRPYEPCLENEVAALQLWIADEILGALTR